VFQILKKCPHESPQPLKDVKSKKKVPREFPCSAEEGKADAVAAAGVVLVKK
jgi:hypothetical protein